MTKRKQELIYLLKTVNNFACFQVIYEACYTTTDLEYFQSRGATKTSCNIESTSSSNHRVGTGKGSDQQEGVSVDNLSVLAEDGAVGLSLTSCLRRCQSRDDMRLSNEPAEEPTSSPTLAGVMPSSNDDAAPTKDSEAKGSAVFSFSATGFDSTLSEQLVSPDPDSVKLTVKLDMTDNLQEKQLKPLKTYNEPLETYNEPLKTYNESPTNCYKGIVYHSTVFFCFTSTKLRRNCIPPIYSILTSIFVSCNHLNDKLFHTCNRLF